MLIFMLVLPPLFGGQIMIWWSTVLARVFSAILAFILIKYCEKEICNMEYRKFNNQIVARII